MKKVLVIGKAAQLTSMTKLQITGRLKTQGTISDSSEIEFQTVDNQKNFPLLVNKMQQPTVLLIGLKPPTINEITGNISKNTDKKIRFVIVACEGDTKMVSSDCIEKASIQTREEFGLQVA